MTLGTVRAFAVFLILNWVTLPAFTVVFIWKRGFWFGIGFLFGLIFLDGVLQKLTSAVDGAFIDRINEEDVPDWNNPSTTRVPLYGGTLMILGTLSHVALPWVAAAGLYLWSAKGADKTVISNSVATPITPPPPSPLQSSQAAQILSQPSSSRSRWHKYRGPDGRFEMLMPGKPDSKQEQGFEVFEADDDLGAIRLMVGDNTEGITEFTPETIRGANRYMESFGYKFKERLRLNGHPALSYSMPRMDSPLKELKDIKASGEILFTFTKKNVYMVFIGQPDGAEKTRKDWRAKIVSSIKLKD